LGRTELLILSSDRLSVRKYPTESSLLFSSKELPMWSRDFLPSSEFPMRSKARFFRSELARRSRTRLLWNELAKSPNAFFRSSELPMSSRARFWENSLKRTAWSKSIHVYVTKYCQLQHNQSIDPSINQSINHQSINLIYCRPMYTYGWTAAFWQCSTY